MRNEQRKLTKGKDVREETYQVNPGSEMGERDQVTFNHFVRGTLG